MKRFEFRISNFEFVLCLLLVSCSAPVDKQQPPEVKPLGKVDFPAYQKRVLPNGLTVYALEYHEQPVVSLRLLIKVGADHDPAHLAGVAAFTADLLNKGTKTRSATQIAEGIDQVGGSLEASADMESTTLSAGALTDPAFAQQEIMRAQQQALSSITADMEDPDFIADAAFQRLIYGPHPYGHLENGTLTSIPKIRREDLIRFHETYYAPNISALAIVGDLSTAEAFNLAERWFGSWTKKDVPQPDTQNVPKSEGRQVVVIDKPDAVQTEIRVGQTTVRRKDPDYFNVLVASYVLGGSGSGRLNQTLRVERGLTYGAYATIQPRKGLGSFYSTTDTRTEKTAEALNLLLEQIQKFREREVPADELQNAKSFLIGSFPLSIEVPNNLASRLTTVFLYDLGDDYLKTYRERLATVSAADVLRAAKEKISPENVVIVLVGKAGEFTKQLEGFGKTDVIPISKLNWDSPNLR
ncbi:MAG: hypothetical protein DMG13_19665 [Acidobacteria bacterium]|nr:MAG: hypothetical protein DMG13_19665 [Acidobacteriota bacterium]